MICFGTRGEEDLLGDSGSICGDTSTMTTVMSTSRVESGRFSSRSCTFRRTHTSENPIRLLCIRLALPLTFSLPSRFAPSDSWLVFHLGPYGLRGIFRVTMFWEDRGGELQPVGPQMDTATITTVYSTNHVDSGSFSSRCGTFRRRHTSADPIRLLCIRLALPLTLSWLSRFAPSARLLVYVSPRALWLTGTFLCHYTFWDERGGGLTRQPVGPLADTATITTVMSTHRVESRGFSSRCCTFRRPQTSADLIRLLCIRPALP